MRKLSYLGFVLGVIGVIATANAAEKVSGGNGSKGDPVAGKKVYEANCMLCHGAAGKGDGPASGALNPKPMNFTDASRMSKVDEATRIKAVTEGGASVGVSAVMPSFKDTLSKKQIEDVVSYIRHNFTH